MGLMFFLIVLVSVFVAGLVWNRHQGAKALEGTRFRSAQPPAAVLATIERVYGHGAKAALRTMFGGITVTSLGPTGFAVRSRVGDQGEVSVTADGGGCVVSAHALTLHVGMPPRALRTSSGGVWALSVALSHAFLSLVGYAPGAGALHRWQNGLERAVVAALPDGRTGGVPSLTRAPSASVSRLTPTAEPPVPTRTSATPVDLSPTTRSGQPPAAPRPLDRTPSPEPVEASRDRLPTVPSTTPVPATTPLVHAPERPVAPAGTSVPQPAGSTTAMASPVPETRPAGPPSVDLAKRPRAAAVVTERPVVTLAKSASVRPVVSLRKPTPEPTRGETRDDGAQS